MFWYLSLSLFALCVSCCVMSVGSCMSTDFFHGKEFKPIYYELGVASQRIYQDFIFQQSSLFSSVDVDLLKDNIFYPSSL